MREFEKYHPIVNFVYFFSVIAFSMLLMNPVCLVISLFCALCYKALLKGVKRVLWDFCYILPTLLLTSLINPAFNHKGMSVIAYLPSGNPLTMESVVYGFCAGIMLASVVVWFSCFNEIMTSDKIIYLFGKITPSLSLVFSMALRFVPHFAKELKNISSSLQCVGKDVKNGNVLHRAKSGLEILSIMITRSLENAVDSADSMKSRGFGTTKRTSFSLFRFDKRDAFTFVLVMIFSLCVLAVMLSGKMEFTFFPSIVWQNDTFCGIFGYIAYFILCSVPTVIELWEVKRWKSLKWKI